MTPCVSKRAVSHLFEGYSPCSRSRRSLSRTLGSIPWPRSPTRLPCRSGLVEAEMRTTGLTFVFVLESPDLSFLTALLVAVYGLLPFSLSSRSCLLWCSGTRGRRTILSDADEEECSTLTGCRDCNVPVTLVFDLVVSDDRCPKPAGIAVFLVTFTCARWSTL